MAKQSIFLDPVNPHDFLHLNMVFCCEQCTHYDEAQKRCTIGHNSANHNKATQLKTYELSGRMAICRNMEID